MKHIRYVAIFFAVLLGALLIYAIVKQIEEYHLKKDPKLHELREIFSKFFKRDKYWGGKLQALNKRNIVNETDLLRGNKSYTINKERVFLCLRDENGEYYPLNMLIYVLAHEYSHVICESIGHTDEFHAIFEELLVELADAGIYDPSKPIDQDYCQHGDD